MPAFKLVIGFCRILAGIQPAELRRRGATLSLGRCAMEGMGG